VGGRIMCDSHSLPADKFSGVFLQEHNVMTEGDIQNRHDRQAQENEAFRSRGLTVQAEPRRAEGGCPHAAIAIYQLTIAIFNCLPTLSGNLIGGGPPHVK
jgi:hypothetical protein